FDWKKISKERSEFGISDCKLEMAAVRSVYRHVCTQMDDILGLRGPRPRPLAIFAADYQGSKFGSFRPATSHNLHVHSLWASNPKEAKIMEAALRSFRTRYSVRHQHVDQIDVRRFDPMRFTLEKAAGYTM